MQICIIGMTGSGKTTLAQALELETKLPRFSSGDIARSLAEEDPDTEVALRAGAFAPEDAIRLQVRQLVEMADLSDGGWILEGFPRKVEQLVEIWRWGIDPIFVYIEIDPMIAVRRLIERGRPDDNGDSIARKLRSFEETTLPVVRMLEDSPRLMRVDSQFHTAKDVLAFCRGVEATA